MSLHNASLTEKQASSTASMRQSCLLSSGMQHLARVWKLEEKTQAQLTSMFDTTAGSDVVHSALEVLLLLGLSR